MAATSPYTANDYQAVSNLRPYELPINDIFKAYVKLDEFWKAGAARVRSVYDNALNLKLTLEPNKELRRKYMEDAEKQLTKLSAMDLSDPAVQRKGFALFKPLFQDEGIIYDDLATRHYEKVRNDALSFRTKENGKYYSDYNFRHAMHGYEKFATSTDRFAGKDAYVNRREYIPFTDYTESMQKALKNCNPSTYTNQSPIYGEKGAMTGYQKESYVKSLSAAQIKSCLETGLNANDLRQLQIEGEVSYRDHPNILGADVASYLTQVGENLSGELQRIEAAKAALLKNPSNLTKEQLAAAQQQLNQQSDAITDELNKTNNATSKIQGGDLTDVLNNQDMWAGSVYTYKKLYKKALASAFEERKDMTEMDPIQALNIRFKNEEYLTRLENDFSISLEQMRQDFDREMKMMDIMYGGKSSQGTTSPGSYVVKNPLTGEYTVAPDLMRETPNVTGKPSIDNKAYERLLTSVSNLSGRDNTNNLTLYNSMISRAERDMPFRETLLKGFNYGVTEDEWTRFKASTANNRFTLSKENNRAGSLHETTWFKAYTQTQPNDEIVDRWAVEHTNVNGAKNTINRKIELAEAEVQKRLGGDLTAQIQNNIKSIPSATIYKGSRDNATPITVTAQEMQDAIEGKPSRVRIVEKSLSGLGYTGTTDKSDVDIFVDGLEIKERSATDSPIKNLYNKIREVNKSVNNKLISTRTDVYGDLGFDREAWYFTDDDGKSAVSTALKNIFKGPEGKELDIRVVSSDFAGGVKVAIPGKSESQMLEGIRAAGIGTEVDIQGPFAVIKGTQHNMIPQAINNPMLRDAAYQLDTVSQTTAFQQTQPGLKVANSDINVPVLIAGKMRNMTVETYKVDNLPEFRVYMEGATTSEPLVVANNPYVLFEKLNTLRVQFKQPINGR